MTTLLSHRTITQIGKYADIDISHHSEEILLSLFRQMLRLRRTELALHEEYRSGRRKCDALFTSV